MEYFCMFANENLVFTQGARYSKNKQHNINLKKSSHG